MGRSVDEAVRLGKPLGMAPVTTHRLWLDGQPAGLFQTGVAAFGVGVFAGSVEVTVEIAEPIRQAVLRPLRLGLSPEIVGNRLLFRLDGPVSLSLEINGLQPLYLFAAAPETDPPDLRDPRVHYFAAGQVHEIGALRLQSGETAYLEEGAIVRGAFWASEAENICIRGRGILDGSCYVKDRNPCQGICLDRCRRVRLEGLTMIHPSTWMVVLGACEDVHVDGIKQIGEVVSSDGIDVVGCRRVLIENCFLRNNDDCVVVKATTGRLPNGQAADWCCDVEDVETRHCTLYNDHAGNAMEIGFELRTASVRGIVFRDIDVIGAHGEGAVFSIHNGDRATVREVLYEDIRIEHFYDKFIDFRVLDSRYSRDAERGQVRQVTLRRIRAIADIFNTVSVIGGWDAAHTVEGVRFEDLRLGERRIDGGDALQLFTNAHSAGVQFA